MEIHYRVKGHIMNTIISIIAQKLIYSFYNPHE